MHPANRNLLAFGYRVLGCCISACAWALAYLRGNLPQELLAEFYRVFQVAAS